MEFKETVRFEREAKRYLTDDELSEIESEIIRFPHAGAQIGDLVKRRFVYRGAGSRGGLRVIHYRIVANVVLLGSVFPKTAKADLTPNEYVAVRNELQDLANQIGLV